VRGTGAPVGAGKAPRDVAELRRASGKAPRRLGEAHRTLRRGSATSQGGEPERPERLPDVSGSVCGCPATLFDISKRRFGRAGAPPRDVAELFPASGLPPRRPAGRSRSPAVPPLPLGERFPRLARAPCSTGSLRLSGSAQRDRALRGPRRLFMNKTAPPSIAEGLVGVDADGNDTAQGPTAGPTTVSGSSNRSTNMGDFRLRLEVTNEVERWRRPQATPPAGPRPPERADLPGERPSPRVRDDYSASPSSGTSVTEPSPTSVV